MATLDCGAEPRVCTYCRGTGKNRHPHGQEYRCPDCDGSGTAPTPPAKPDRSILHRRFHLDGSPLDQDLLQFITANELDAEAQLAIGDLQVGEELPLGGGAAATSTLKRVA